MTVLFEAFPYGMQYCHAMTWRNALGVVRDDDEKVR